MAEPATEYFVEASVLDGLSAEGGPLTLSERRDEWARRGGYADYADYQTRSPLAPRREHAFATRVPVESSCGRAAKTYFVLRVRRSPGELYSERVAKSTYLDAALAEARARCAEDDVRAGGEVSLHERESTKAAAAFVRTADGVESR